MEQALKLKIKGGEFAKDKSSKTKKRTESASDQIRRKKQYDRQQNEKLEKYLNNMTSSHKILSRKSQNFWNECNKTELNLI